MQSTQDGLGRDLAIGPSRSKLMHSGLAGRALTKRSVRTPIIENTWHTLILLDADEPRRRASGQGSQFAPTSAASPKSRIVRIVTCGRPWGKFGPECHDRQTRS